MSQTSQRHNYHPVLRFAKDGTPHCFCNKPAKELTSKTTTNPGRVFYKCYECNYFKWKDELPPQANSSQQPAPPLTQQPKSNQPANSRSAPATPTKHTETSVTTPLTIPIKRSHVMSTGADSLPDPRPTQRRNLSPGAKQKRFDEIVNAQREAESKKMTPNRFRTSVLSKQSGKKGLDAAIQTDVVSDTEDEDERTENGSGDFDDNTLNTLASDVEELVLKKGQVKSEADEAKYLSTQRSSRTTSISSARNLVAGQLLTPPHSSAKEVEDELLRRDRAGSESPTQATRKGKQKAKEFYESIGSASGPSFNERLASAMNLAATMNASDDADDTQRTMPEVENVSDMFKEAMNNMSRQMQSIFQRMEAQNTQYQLKLTASEHRVKELERKLAEMEEKNKELEVENSSLAKTLRVIHNAVSQSPSSTPMRS